MDARRFDLIALGECMVELYADAPLAQASRLNKSYGGDVLNALVTASRLAGRTGFISRVGNDPFGSGLIAAWQAEGIDTAAAPLVDGENGIYFISLLEDGEREFTYRRSASAATTLTAAALDPAYIANASCLLISGITQAVSEGAREATLRAAQIAHAEGLLVAYDPNYRPALWAKYGGLAAARAALREVAPFVTFVLPSFPADAALLDANATDPNEALRQFQGYCTNVALKQGANGCHLACVDSPPRHVAGAVQPHVIDTTGAGDAWNGAFLLGLVQGLAASTAAFRANQVAAAKLAFRGAIPPIA